MKQAHRAFLAVAVLGMGLGAYVYAHSPSHAPQAAAVKAQPPASRAAAPQVASGGSLVATMRSEPRSFNPHAGRDFASSLVGPLDAGAPGAHQPRHAAARAVAGRVVRLRARRPVVHAEAAPRRPLLRRHAVHVGRRAVLVPGGVRREDGQPAGRRADASAASRSPSPRPTRTPSSSRSRRPFGPGLRLLDALPILPKHKLEAALQGRHAAAAVGPGHAARRPRRARPVRRCRSTRPASGSSSRATRSYWRKDAAGAPLPYLDRLTIEITPDQNTELLRLQSGQADLTQSEIRPDDYAALKREAAAGKLRLIDAGLAFDADAFWFNLKPGAKAHDGRPWLHAPGAAPGGVARREPPRVCRRRCSSARPSRSGGRSRRPTRRGSRPTGADRSRTPTTWRRARVLLAGLGLRDTNSDGMLEDAAGAAGAVLAHHAEGQHRARERRGLHPRRAEEGRPRRRRGAARSGRARRPHDEGRLRRALLPLPHHATPTRR